MSLGESGMEVSSAQPRDLPHAYDPYTDVPTICGVQYSGELFRQLGGGLALHRAFELIAREPDGTITIRTLAAGEVVKPW